LRDLRQWLGPVRLSFSGGEALLRPFTADLARYACSIGLRLEVLTHGYWDDQKRIEELALTGLWRVTVSVDGIGETHSKIRGRTGFWEKTQTSLETLKRVRQEKKLDYTIRLKTVLMQHNVEVVHEVARFAGDNGMEVYYQPIEQNYNTPEDPLWFEHCDNWPRDTAKAVAAVEQLIRMKREGFPIANTHPQLEVMIPYFRNPAPSRVAVQIHSAHEREQNCAALTMLQFQANGDVVVCARTGPVGNIKTKPIRQIWEERPNLWEQGCCLERQ
jgi:MoaA/NifB/PqqE/SkfB family radical SAM enzyme